MLDKNWMIGRTRPHINDADKKHDIRLAQILAIHDGNVLYHRLDIPWNTTPTGERIRPRTFVLPEREFFGRYV